LLNISSIILLLISNNEAIDSFPDTFTDTVFSLSFFLFNSSCSFFRITSFLSVITLDDTCGDEIIASYKSLIAFNKSFS